MTTKPPDDDLKEFWEDVRAQPLPSPDLRHFDAHPGELVIGTQGRVLVRIQPDGQLRYGEGYTPDDAAEVFWTSLALKRAGMEQRLMHLGLLEQLLIRIGHADLQTERARIYAGREGATEHDRFMAERAIGHLESLVHQMIELGRGLALRVPEAPVQVQPAPIAQAAAVPQPVSEEEFIRRYGRPPADDFERTYGRPPEWDEAGFP